MKRALVLVVALACTAAAAEPPADAPVREGITKVQEANILTPDGERVFVEGGRHFSPEAYVATAKEVAQLRAENASLKESPGFSPWAVIALGVLAAGVGYGAGKLLQQP